MEIEKGLFHTRSRKAKSQTLLARNRHGLVAVAIHLLRRTYILAPSFL